MNRLRKLKLEAERRRRSSLVTEKPKDLRADVERALADVRITALDRERCYIPGVKLDSDDPQAHAGKEPNGLDWMR